MGLLVDGQFGMEDMAVVRKASGKMLKQVREWFAPAGAVGGFVLAWRSWVRLPEDGFLLNSENGQDGFDEVDGNDRQCEWLLAAAMAGGFTKVEANPGFTGRAWRCLARPAAWWCTV